MADQKIIEQQAIKVIAMEKKISGTILALKDQQEAIDANWAKVKDLMIENDIKSIKGEWGTLTIAEKINWEYDPSQLAPKFFKKVVDTKKLTDTFRLEGKEPKAATAKYIKYLMRRIK